MSTICIRRHEVRYRVPRGAPAISFDAARLTEPLAERPPVEGDGMWLIRRLDVHACVGSHWSDRRVAGTWAASVAGELGEVLERGADGDTALWFPDRATFLGRYLVDCARGRAGGRWEYEAFDTTGEPSAALSAAIAGEPAVARDALAHLTAADLGVVLAALSPADAARVLSLLDESSAASGDPARLVLAAVRRLIDSAADWTRDRRIIALAIFADVARHGAPPRGTALRARDAAELAVAMARAPNETAEHLARVIELGDWGGVIGVLGARAMEALSGLVGWEPLVRADLVRAFAGARDGRPSGPPVADEMTTALGGMFLLLPLLGDLPWAATTSTWPPLGDVAPEVLARYLAVVGALGPARHAPAARDAVLRLALGVPHDLDATTISAWAASVPPPPVAPGDDLREFVVGVPFGLPERFGLHVAEASHTLLRALARRLPGFADASAGYLWENVLACSASVQIEPARFVVRLSNPPLGVLLSLTGLNRTRFRLDATGDAEWCLTQA